MVGYRLDTREFRVSRGRQQTELKGLHIVLGYKITLKCIWGLAEGCVGLITESILTFSCRIVGTEQLKQRNIFSLLKYKRSGQYMIKV